MKFEVISDIYNIETIAVGNAMRDLQRLCKRYGSGRWRKLKGTATVIIEDGTVFLAELHWYEAHGIGKRALKIKRPLE